MVADTIKLFFSSWYIYVIFGMIFGSFLNVVIYRIPNGLSIISPPSSCPKCGHSITWYENIPVLSWLALKGKCSGCKQPISSEYPLIEMASGLITLGLYLYAGPSLILTIYIPLAYILLCIMIIDYKTYSIPYILNITLFIICAAAVFINFFYDGFLEINFLYSILGAVTGFGILYLIQIAGKIIYKQDAVGTGDLFLLGSAGLLLGPKLIFYAFILGSITAVISYAIPTLTNLKKRKQESEKYKTMADLLNYSPTNPGEELDLLGLKMQLSYNLKAGKNESFQNEITGKTFEIKTDNITSLRLFFRFVAVGNIAEAEKNLMCLDINRVDIVEDIKKVVNEDMIGYDSPKDNLELLADYSKGLLENKFFLIIKENRNNILEDNRSESIAKIEKYTDSITDTGKKLDYLLGYNRYFQFNGYTAEQKKIIQLIEKKAELSRDGLRQKYLADTAYVYFKDFYFADSKKIIAELQEELKKEPAVYDTVKSLYNISLFRLVFYKQRLAFGPFLAIGIMLSLLWGNIIIIKYYEFLERMFL